MDTGYKRQKSRLTQRSIHQKWSCDILTAGAIEKGMYITNLWVMLTKSAAGSSQPTLDNITGRIHHVPIFLNIIVS